MKTFLKDLAIVALLSVFGVFGGVLAFIIQTSA